MHDYWLFAAWRQPGISHDEVWSKQARDSAGCRTGIRSLGFRRARPFAGCLVIGMYGSLRSLGAQKNCLRRLWMGTARVVRSDEATRPRPAEWCISHRAGTRGAARGVPGLRREARTAGFPGRQSALHQALCLLRRPTLPAGLDPRYRQGAEAYLGHGQGAGDAIHARPSSGLARRHRERLASTRSRLPSATPIASWSAT